MSVFSCWGMAQAADQSLTVFAAASLREPFQEIAREFERTHPGVKVHLNFAGSQQLATQLTLGAKADVFASADTQQMEKVAKVDRSVRKSVRMLARNRLAVAVAPTSLRKIASLKSIGDAGIRVVVASPSVPAGGYSQQALKLAARQFGDKWLAAVNANIVSRELDVRSVLAKVELGEGDAGIVYGTDIQAAGKKVAFVPIPAAFNVVATYLVAPLADSAGGGEFVKLALGHTGRGALSRCGFLIPKP